MPFYFLSIQISFQSGSYPIFTDYPSLPYIAFHCIDFTSKIYPPVVLFSSFYQSTWAGQLPNFLPIFLSGLYHIFTDHFLFNIEALLFHIFLYYAFFSS